MSIKKIDISNFVVMYARINIGLIYFDKTLYWWLLPAYSEDNCTH